MKIVIEIPDEEYENVKKAGGCYYDFGKAIYYGTPLPKGHGRIGDLDALREEVSSWGMNDYEPLDFIDAIDDAQTIIEADKEKKNE